VEIEKTFLVLNSKDNGTVEMNDVRLILPPPLSVVAQTVQLKLDFCYRSERVFYLFVYIKQIKIRCNQISKVLIYLLCSTQWPIAQWGLFSP